MLFTKVLGGWRDGLGKVHPSPLLPDGSPMEVFKKYPAVLLKDVPHAEMKKGDRGVVMTVPHGGIFLSYINGPAFKVNAQPGVDFDFA